MIKNRFDFKLILKYDEKGNIFSVMEKPNLKKIDSKILVSGAHVFTTPEHNHCDFFLNGSLIYKEFPNVKDFTNYGYTISGAALIV